MKSYLLTFTDPKLLLKKLGVFGLVILIPVMVFRLLVAIVFGSWIEALKSLMALTLVLFIFDFTYFFASRRGDSKKEDKPSHEPEVKDKESSTDEEDPLAEIIKNKLNK